MKALKQKNMSTTKLKTHEELNICPDHHRNLARLAVYVREEVDKERFNIKTYFSNSEKGEHHYADEVCPRLKEYSCGTTACLLGYGIPAGIKAKKEEKWCEYIERAFGIKSSVKDTVFSMLFDAHHVNSKKAAVRRIAWYLMYGIPEDDAVVMTHWEAPLKFKPNWKAIKKLANK